MVIHLAMPPVNLVPQPHPFPSSYPGFCPDLVPSHPIQLIKQIVNTVSLICDISLNLRECRGEKSEGLRFVEPRRIAESSLSVLTAAELSFHPVTFDMALPALAV